MKFLQQLAPLLETHEVAQKDQLEESSVIRALDQLRKYTIRDIADFAFLHFLILFILQEDEEKKVIVRGHATRTLQHVDFKKLSFVGTDLYVYLHLLLGHNRDKLKHTSQSDLFYQRCHLTARELKQMLRNMANGHRDPAMESRFLLMLEKNLQIDTANYRSCRRLVASWSDTETYNRKLVITRILLALRTRTPNSDLLVHFETYSKRHNSEIKKASNPERINEDINNSATRNQPFTEAEVKQILKVIEGFETNGKNSISAKALGFAGEEHEMPGWIMDGIRFGVHGRGKVRKEIKKLQLSEIYAQDQEGVGLKNLRTVLEHWSTAPMPEVLALPNGKYWLIEGHHRLALQRIANRNEYEVIVEYDDVSKLKGPRT